MFDIPTPRIKVPDTIRFGETIEIKALISHDMESGQRRNKDGELIPRRIINTFTCSFNSTPFFIATFGPGISANPFLSFYFRATESGVLNFKWVDDDGSEYTARHEIHLT